MGLIERRYTFGNDKFSLEDAYYDCKLVFDGITDDDSFQEADTGLVLYYANEIIYALRKALEGKDTNVLGNDCVSRRAVIDAIQKLDIPEDMCVFEVMSHIETEIATLPSAKPERKKGEWILVKGSNGKDYHKCSECLHTLDITGVKNYCAVCGAEMTQAEGKERWDG